MNKIAIVGCGYVGNGMNRIFPEATIIDPPKGTREGYGATDGCDLAIVCVPTPRRSDGSCDTSIVEAVVSQLYSEIVLVKSTVTPGTCDRIAGQTGKRIVFSPEYMGESRYWTPPEYPSPTDALSHRFVILGGERDDCSRVTDIMLPRFGPATRFRFMSRVEAELVKYFENAFFAMKVAFANEVRRISELSGANYHVVREGWLDDPRVGPMHTAAFAGDRGFDGKCLPKDIAALAHYCRAMGQPSLLLEATIQSNDLNRRIPTCCADDGGASHA